MSRPRALRLGAYAGPGRAASYVYINPFVAVLLGWGVAGEALTPRMLAAGGAIVLAVVLIVRGTPSETRVAAPTRTGLRRLTEREA
jgi:drug/metabolite transporter (DMT)-like permease